MRGIEPWNDHDGDHARGGARLVGDEVRMERRQDFDAADLHTRRPACDRLEVVDAD